ncbi:MAG: hypothetical protein AB7I18_05380 [Candidatus Berkiella sp.]
MQQVLELLKKAATTAAQKGFTTTQKQLELWYVQLGMIAATQNVIPLTVQLLSKAVAGIQATLNSSTSDDATLYAQCQAQATTLFQSHNLVQEYVAQRKKLQQSNQNAQKNQKYFDEKKNAAVTNFNQYLAQLLAKNILSNEDLMAFNKRLRETLAKDFDVKHLAEPQPQATAEPKSEPKPAPQKQPAAVPQAAGNVMSGLSKIFNAATSNDPEAMKEASKNFIGFLISMVVECIASVCRIVAPTMGPFISQMANMAKGAFSNWFSTNMDTGIQSAKDASKQQAAPSTSAAAPTASAAPVTQGYGGAMLSALQNFMSRNRGVNLPVAPVAPAPAAPRAASPKI